MDADVTYRPIGVVHSPFASLEGMPIQPAAQRSAPGTVEVFAEFAEGLTDIEGFSHLILVVHFHQAEGVNLSPTPFLDRKPHGIFATRAPVRPNPIGISVVHLAGVDGNLLHIANIDLVDRTPVLDIKPYVPQFDTPGDCRIGWMEASIDTFDAMKSDDRFA